MELKERLKYARESLALGQKEMAETLGIGLKSWQVYEQGSSTPGGKVFEALVKHGFNANWLLTGEGKARNEETVYAVAGELKRADTTGEALSEYELATAGVAKASGTVKGGPSKAPCVPFDEGLLEHIIIEIIKNQRWTDDETQNIFVEILAQSTAASIIHAYKMSLDLPVEKQQQVIENYNKLFAKLDEKLNVIADKRGV